MPTLTTRALKCTVLLDPAELEAIALVDGLPRVQLNIRVADGRTVTADIATLVEEARAVRDGLTALAVLNAADPGDNRDNLEAAEALADFPQLTLLDAPIRRRKAFSNATGQGMSVDELAPVDAKASAELAALISKVLSLAYATNGNGG